ncbi:hypothetical protein FJ251_09630 [bacterium]|nr:hypothetical protein [bacterium]
MHTATRQAIYLGQVLLVGFGVLLLRDGLLERTSLSAVGAYLVEAIWFVLVIGLGILHRRLAPQRRWAQMLQAGILGGSIPTLVVGAMHRFGTGKYWGYFIVALFLVIFMASWSILMKLEKPRAPQPGT